MCREACEYEGRIAWHCKQPPYVWYVEGESPAWLAELTEEERQKLAARCAVGVHYGTYVANVPGKNFAVALCRQRCVVNGPTMTTEDLVGFELQT